MNNQQDDDEEEDDDDDEEEEDDDDDDEDDDDEQHANMIVKKNRIAGQFLPKIRTLLKEAQLICLFVCLECIREGFYRLRF